MSGFRGPSYEDAIALAQRMASNPADSVSLAGELVKLIANLPPTESELLSRPDFERASLWTLGVNFENLQPNTQQLKIIEMQHAVWIRGVQAQAYPLLTAGDPSDLANTFTQLSFYRFLAEYAGWNGRALFEANWRLNGRQGFISSGSSDAFAPAVTIAGDGFYSAPLDWKLQKGETLEIRVQSRMGEILPPNTSLTPPSEITTDNRTLPLVTIGFWAEEIQAPSVQ